MEHDGENAPPSRLPQFKNSRIASPTKSSLGEISASSMNTRNGEMGPPATTGQKRKTLADRAGEPRRAPQAPTISASAIAGNKPSSWSGSYRQPSFSSSVASSRPSSVASSRNISGGSYTSTMSTTSRPPSAQAHRSQSAMAGSSLRRPQSTQGRPASSLDAHATQPAVGRGQGQRTGCPESLEVGKTRGSHDTHTRSVAEWASSNTATGSSRNFSPSNDLSLEESRLPSTPKAIQKREISITTAMGNMSLSSDMPPPMLCSVDPATPSHIPKLIPKATVTAPARSPSKSPKKASAATPRYLNRNTNTVAGEDFNVDDRMERMENVMSEIESKFAGAETESKELKEIVAVYKARVVELESMKTQLTSNIDTLNSDLNMTKADLTSSKAEITGLSNALEDSKRHRDIQLEDAQRRHHRELDESQHQAQDRIFQMERKYTIEREDLERQLNKGLEEEKVRYQQDLQAMTNARAKSQEEVEGELDRQRKQMDSVEDELRKSRADLACEKNLNSDLRVKLSESSSHTISLESSIRSLRAHVDFLESDNKSQSHAFTDLDNRLQNAIQAAEEAKDKLRTEETLRRKLHNQVQELKGNIRVFCRVRPSLGSEPVDSSARITYPDNDSDSKEVE
ncbi:MAG: hypothetical protein Q9224_005947, partial [Gallowayella concinna]